MAIKYLYLDDETQDVVRPFIRELERHGSDMTITHVSPLPYSKQLPSLYEQSFDGIILDLRLDEKINQETSERAEYRAPTLAQEIRTRATEGVTKFEVPLVLWSTDEKLRKSYKSDDTSHDLFDFKCIKDELAIPEKAEVVANKLHALALGYQEIAKIRSKKRGPGSQLYKFLGFDEEPEFLDSRLLGAFEGKDSPIPAHEYARFLLRDLLDQQGPLINEAVMAARLGIDQTSRDWSNLKDMLSVARYNGPFREGWPRWWTFLVERWWQNLDEKMPPLRQITAEERVKLIRAKTKFKKLEPAEPIQDSYDTRFWTICEVLEQPLDPKDGFVLNQPDAKVWYDRLYVSVRAELSGQRHEGGLVIDPLEKSRIERLRDSLH